MINLFQLLKKHEKSLTEGFENKKYWETREDNRFERNVIGPDGNYYDQEVTIQGFVDKIRNLQYVQFVIVRDNTGKVQVTIEKNEENIELSKVNILD